MKTLLETTELIKSIDTPPDVLAQACLAVLSNDKAEPEGVTQLAELIIEVFWNKPYDGGDLMSACAQAAGRLAGAMVKPGGTATLVRGLSAILNRSFAEVLTVRLDHERKHNPSLAAKFLIEMLMSGEDSSEERSSRRRKPDRDMR